jgi:catechol 2,3-dioxygenase-like lactoylglutathione lyase family enzyme
MWIKMTSVYVDDPAGKAFEFYTATLGFEPLMHVPEANLAIVVSPEQRGGTALLLEPNDNPIAKSYQQALYDQGLPCIVFGVDDVQREHERLRSLGVTFTQEPATSEWGTTAVFSDGCGNLIQLHQD